MEPDRLIRSMALTPDALAMRIQALEQEKSTNDNKFQDAATRILGLEADIRALRQHVLDGEKRNKREILESKAIQSLTNMREAKEHRAWNVKMRNAFDQARPMHGRKILMWLETITEKRIDEESEKNDRMSSLELIKDL